MFNGVSTKYWLIFALLSCGIYLIVYHWLLPSLFFVPCIGTLLLLLRFNTHVSKIINDRLIIDSLISFIFCIGVGTDYLVVAYLLHCIFTVVVNSIMIRKTWINYFILIMMSLITIIAIIKSNNIMFNGILCAIFGISMLVYFITIQSIQCNHNLYMVLKNIHEKTLQAYDIDRRIIKHEICNILSPIFSYIEFEQYENLSLIYKQILRRYHELMDYEDNNCNIKGLMNYVNKYYEIDLQGNWEGKTIINTKRLLMILHILIDNAQQAAAKKIFVKRLGKSIIIIDDGNGFDVRKIKNGYTTKKNGHGIGLVVVKELIELSGAHFKIVSQIGHGTTVELEGIYE